MTQPVARGPCIFCKEVHNDLDEEHPIPIGIGGPQELALKNGEVCQSCNNRLSTVDSGLIEAFGILKTFAATRTRRGKSPSVTQGNVSVSRTDSEILVTVDADKGCEDYAVTPLPNGQTQVTFSRKVTFGAKLARGLHKIAFELVALERGPDAVLREDLDPLRRYIVGRSPGFRPVIMRTCGSIDLAEMAVRNASYQVVDAGDGAHVVQVVLCGAEFGVGVGVDAQLVISHAIKGAVEIEPTDGQGGWVTFDERGIRQPLR